MMQRKYINDSMLYQPHPILAMKMGHEVQETDQNRPDFSGIGSFLARF